MCTQSHMDSSVQALQVRRIATVSICTSLIIAGSYFSVPIPWSPAPISLASMFVTLSGLVLGARRGACACLLYLGLGAVGLPVFANATGGIAPLLGPTGGFLLGYPISAFVAGLLFRPTAGHSDEERSRRFFRALAAALVAALVLYIPGVLWLMSSLSLSFPAAIAAAVVPFVAGDILKAIAAAATARTLTSAGTLFESR